MLYSYLLTLGVTCLSEAYLQTEGKRIYDLLGMLAWYARFAPHAKGKVCKYR